MNPIGQYADPSSLPYIVRTRPSPWATTLAILAVGVSIAIIVGLLRTPHPAPSWPLALIIGAGVVGALASPAVLTTFRRIELCEQGIRRKDPLLGTRELPYASLRSMKMEERVVTGKTIERTRHLLIADQEGHFLDINIGDYKLDDLRTLTQIIARRSPNIQMDRYVRALRAGSSG